MAWNLKLPPFRCSFLVLHRFFLWRMTQCSDAHGVRFAPGNPRIPSEYLRSDCSPGFCCFFFALFSVGFVYQNWSDLHQIFTFNLCFFFNHIERAWNWTLDVGGISKIICCISVGPCNFETIHSHARLEWFIHNINHWIQLLGLGRTRQHDTGNRWKTCYFQTSIVALGKQPTRYLRPDVTMTPIPLPGDTHPRCHLTLFFVMVDSLYCGLTLAMQDSLVWDGRDKIIRNRTESNLNMIEYDDFWLKTHHSEIVDVSFVN